MLREVKYYQITCAKCGREVGNPHEQFTEAWRAAALAGWRTTPVIWETDLSERPAYPTGGQHFCPKCWSENHAQ